MLVAVKPAASRCTDPPTGSLHPLGSAPAHPVVLVTGLCFLALGLAAPAGAIVIGQPKPFCEETQELEGSLYVEVSNPAEGEPRYVEIRNGGSDPVVLTEGSTYRLGLRAGEAALAPAVPARYRVEGESFLTFSARVDGNDGLPLEREFSINALKRLVIWARNPGRRKLFLRVSECWKGGGRYLHAPAETLIPIVVVPAAEAGAAAAPGP